jgi:ABC-type sugar transport system substrate-binding protein
VEFFRPHKGGIARVEEMAGMLDDIIGRRFNSVVIGPVDHDLIAQKLREMNRLGIKIVFINSKLDNVDYVSLIQTEGKAAGATAAKAVMGAMGTQGEVIVNTWADMYISAIEDRKAGFIQEIHKSSNIVVHEAPVKGKPVGAEKETFDNILYQYPNARFMFLTNCEWGVAFAEYAKKYRPKIQVVVIDFTKDIQKAMNEGYIQYAIGQRAYSWAAWRSISSITAFRTRASKNMWIQVRLRSTSKTSTYITASYNKTQGKRLG